MVWAGQLPLRFCLSAFLSYKQTSPAFAAACRLFPEFVLPSKTRTGGCHCLWPETPLTTLTLLSPSHGTPASWIRPPVRVPGAFDLNCSFRDLNFKDITVGGTGVRTAREFSEGHCPSQCGRTFHKSSSALGFSLFSGKTQSFSSFLKSLPNSFISSGIFFWVTYSLE